MTLNTLINRKLGLGITGVALLIGFAWVVVRSGPLAPIRVTTALVQSGNVSTALFGIGVVEARRGYFIGPTAAGRVRSVSVDVGDSVKSGQLLAELDPVDLDDRIRSIDAAYARASSAVAAAEALQTDARARQSVAELNAVRYRELGAKNFVSASAVEAKQQELTSARAGVDSSRANLDGARKELTRLRADQDGLRVQKNNLRLLAPADAVVTSRDAEVGATVVAGQSALKLIDPASLWVRVRLDQGRSRGLAVGQSAEIVLRSQASQRLPGKVARIELVSDSVTEERVVLVAFDQIPPGLGVGELSEVTIATGAGKNVLSIPNAAVKHSPNGTSVWILRDGKPVSTPITLGETSLDGIVQVTAGLATGDEIVVHSERELVEGGRIKVAEQLFGKPK